MQENTVKKMKRMWEMKSPQSIIHTWWNISHIGKTHGQWTEERSCRFRWNLVSYDMNCNHHQPRKSFSPLSSWFFHNFSISIFISIYIFIYILGVFRMKDNFNSICDLWRCFGDLCESLRIFGSWRCWPLGSLKGIRVLLISKSE